MKYILSIFSIFAIATAFSQSKKELKTQLAKQAVFIDSLLIINQNNAFAIDTLKQKLKVKEQVINGQKRQIEDLNSDIAICDRNKEMYQKEYEKLIQEKELQKPKDKLSTKKPAENPFANPFGNGGGTGAGNGGKGDGVGPGQGAPGGNRVLTSRPNPDDIESTEDCQITFLMNIDENGAVVGTPGIVKAKTTTTNAELISKATKLVKEQAKYSAEKGASTVKKELRIVIKAK